MYKTKKLLCTLIIITLIVSMGFGYTPVMAETTWTGKGVKIAIIDTGISPHDDLTISGGVSTVDYTTSYDDDNWHGTYVAGVINAKGNTSYVQGLSPDALIYAVKSMDYNGYGNVVDVVEGIEWCINNKMDIINLSYGINRNINFKLLDNEIKKAQAKGIIIVAASGNTGQSLNGSSTVSYPAAYNGVISVSGIDSNNKIASFSSTGKEIDFCAPSVKIASTYYKGWYCYASGTSIACPYATAIIANLKQALPNATNKQLISILKSNALDLGKTGKDDIYGYGLIQMPKKIPKIKVAKKITVKRHRN